VRLERARRPRQDGGRRRRRQEQELKRETDTERDQHGSDAPTTERAGGGVADLATG